MNKRILAASLILISAVFLFLIQKFIPDIAFNIGKDAYIQKDYPKAFQMFKFATTLNGYNKDYRYYFVETMLQLKPTIQIQKELFKLSQTNMADSADLIADQQIAKWKNIILSNAGDNYIEKVPFNDKILRWDPKTFPLKVNIKNNSSTAPAYYIQVIKGAFIKWQETTNNFIKFEFINDQQNANILVSINSSDTMKKCQGENCKYTVATTVPSISGARLKSMKIMFFDSNNLGKPFTQKEIYNSAVHEIGHALGIMGHSDNKYDVMYMQNNQNGEYDKVITDLQLISQRDLNTINLLYKLIPDITNTDLSKYDTSHQFFAPIVMGSEEEINTSKMQEAQNYIANAPDLPNGYIDLAAAYAEAKQYSKAVTSLNKALNLCSNDDERFVVYYNFAVTYMQIKDWDNALKYATLAKAIQPSADIDGLIAMINYNLGKKELAKQSYTEALSKNPDNIIDSVNLAIIYLRELNPAQAGKVLNKLVKANPEAQNDPRVKSFSLLMLLFK